MQLNFTVAGVPHSAAVPDVANLPEAVAQLHAQIIGLCGDNTPHRYLEARIADGVLNAVVEMAETPIGEVLAGVPAESETTPP